MAGQPHWFDLQQPLKVANRATGSLALEISEQPPKMHLIREKCTKMEIFITKV